MQGSRSLLQGTAVLSAGPRPNANGRHMPYSRGPSNGETPLRLMTCVIPPKMRGWGFNETPPYPAERWCPSPCGKKANGSAMNKRGPAVAPHKELHLGIVRFATIPNKLTEKSHSLTHSLNKSNNKCNSSHQFVRISIS